MAHKNYSTMHTIFTRKMILLTVLGLCAGILIGLVSCMAEDAKPLKAWVICQPGDWINARRDASRKSASLGRLECGDEILLDGRTQDGWAHMVRAGLEEDDAWIWAGYVSFTEPQVFMDTLEVCGGRRIAARKSAGGDVRCWLKSGDEVFVYYRTDEWCVTSQGFIMTKYLEVGSV